MTASTLCLTAVFLVLATQAGAVPPVERIPGSVSPLARGAVDLGPSPLSERHRIVVSLDLRNREELEAFLEEVQDPTSPSYHEFLTQEEFNDLYAPSEGEQEAVVAHLTKNGLTVTDRFSNRLLIGAVGSVGAIERAFGVRLHDVIHKGKRRYSAFEEPSFPGHVAPYIVGVIGLDNLSEMRRRALPFGPVAAPNASLGSNCCHLSPNDLHTFYNNNLTFDGTGQTLVIAGAFAWMDSDNDAFSDQWGLPPLPAGSGQVCTGSGMNPQGCRFSQQNSIEIALDVEYAHGTAPGATILNYMAGSTLFSDFAVMYNRIVTDNPGHVVSTSWGNCEALISTSTQQTNDNIFANANAVGQSWFAASGDDGSRDCNGLLTVDHPANSPHVMGVGGTTPTCSSGMIPSDPACMGYGSETGWSGSGGGISELFSRPSFQTGCGVPAGTTRLVPDVALESDTSPGNYVLKKGSWFIVGGTSGAAPQWAGFFAQLNQKSGDSGLGNPGASLYALCGTTAFHDITSGSNGDYSAGTGYDLVTGLGTIDVANFLSSPEPSPIPAISLQGSVVFLLLAAGGILVTQWRWGMLRRG